jgi:hypothetical protein
MTVPVHNLYDFVHQSTENKYFLIYFYPWGQRAINNAIFYQINDTILNSVNGIADQDIQYSNHNVQSQHSWIMSTQPTILCHDQEPLNFSLYSADSEYIKAGREVWENKSGVKLCNDYNDINLRFANPFSVQKTWILLHSELNSTELKKYEETGNFCGAYWWSHAIIARDWYRYAEHDRTLTSLSTPKKIFLSYCRDTSGSRQYRQEFLNLLDRYQIADHCQVSSFNDNVDVTSDASAVYTADDFNSTAVSIVLETVFDNRIHLTEKTLRPIACGHPFVLAAGPGSLKLLRSYGFQTFHGYIDESYDDIQDSHERLEAIAREMQRIKDLSPAQFSSFRSAIQLIAQYNKKIFFSKEFFQQVVEELKRNVNTAYLSHNGELDFDLWWKQRRYRKQYLGNQWKDIKSNFRSKALIMLCRQRRLEQRIRHEQ